MYWGFEFRLRNDGELDLVEGISWGDVKQSRSLSVEDVKHYAECRDAENPDNTVIIARWTRKSAIPQIRILSFCLTNSSKKYLVIYIYI